MPSVKVNDIDIYYEICGSGEPLVIIEGLAIDISLPSPIIDALAGKYLVIRFDNRGIGRSGKPDAPFSVDTMVADTVGLMDALGIRHAHLLGMSLGSRVALAIAAKYPGRVNGLVLNVTAAYLPYGKNMKVTFALWSLRQLIKSGKIERMLPSRYPPSRTSLLRQWDANKAFDGRGMLAKIRAPTLIVNGTKDISVPLKCGRELEESIPGAKLILAEGDHMFIAKHPEWLTKPALEFLAEVDKRLMIATRA